MNDAIHSQLKALQDQLARVTGAIDDLRPDHPHGRRAWKQAGRRAGELGRETGRLARDHPAATGFLVLGAAALVAGCLLHSRRHD